jgi:hypothetical protein
MTDQSGKSESRKRASRQDRLKRALRENLKRRKAQEKQRERERSQLAEAPTSGHEAPPHGQVGKVGEE